MTTYFRDFSEYDAGALGTTGALDWTIQAVSGNWSATVTVDGAATGGKTCIINRTSTGDATVLAVFDNSVGTADIEVVTRVKHDETITNGLSLGLALVNSDDDQCYAMYFSADTTLALGRFATSGAVGTVIDTETSISKPTINEYYWVRIGRTSTTIRGKMWADGEAEPDWQVSGVNTSLATLVPGFFVRDFSSAPFTFDVFGVGDGGDEAPVDETEATEVTKTPAQAVLDLSGRAPSTSAFTNVRIRDVLINESGQPVASASSIRLMVWYNGECIGAPDVSVNGMTTDANGTASWSISTGSLVNGQSIFYVAQNSISFSTYTCARMIPSYE